MNATTASAVTIRSSRFSSAIVRHRVKKFAQRPETLILSSKHFAKHFGGSLAP
jgi:hypothetical protein